MPTTLEISYGLYGAWRLARLDAGGLSFFDTSLSGFWKSFFAAVLVAPAYIILILFHLTDEPASAGAFGIFLVYLISYTMSWTAFPVVAHAILSAMGREQAFVGFIVALNWSKVIQMVAYLPAAILSEFELLPLGLGGFLAFVISALILVYQWFVTRTALAVTGPAAAGFVLVDLVLGFIITAVSDRMVM